jgi:hypothetical protein
MTIYLELRSMPNDKYWWVNKLLLSYPILKSNRVAMSPTFLGVQELYSKSYTYRCSTTKLYPHPSTTFFVYLSHSTKSRCKSLELDRPGSDTHLWKHCVTEQVA